MLLRHIRLIQIGLTVGLGTARDLILVLEVVFLEGLAAAIERNKAVLWDSGLANGALAGVDIGVAEPFVDARPAVEMAAESHHRFGRIIKTDVAVEAPAGGGRSSWDDRLFFHWWRGSGEELIWTRETANGFSKQLNKRKESMMTGRPDGPDSLGKRVKGEFWLVSGRREDQDATCERFIRSEIRYRPQTSEWPTTQVT
jgi:hypothetical protein